MVPFLVGFREKNPNHKVHLKFNKLVYGKNTYVYDTETKDINFLGANGPNTNLR